MKPTQLQADTAASSLGLNTLELHNALRAAAVTEFERAASEFRSYDDGYGKSIARARRLDTAATVCYEAWDELRAARAGTN